MALHGVGNIKRYHIGKVYRRDQPAMARGRFREFFQCDFDVAGSYGAGASAAMAPDAEVLKVLTGKKEDGERGEGGGGRGRERKREVELLFLPSFFMGGRQKNSKNSVLFPPFFFRQKNVKDVLDALGLDNHEIKLNHRGLLDGGLAAAGVPAAKFKAACSAIDKLDKEPWEAVRRELVDQKGIAGEVADRIKVLVSMRGSPRELVANLREAGSPVFKDGAVVAAASAVASAAASGGGDGTNEETTSSSSPSDAASAKALDELEALASSLEALGITGNRIVLDLSLARGLDYYTGERSRIRV